MSATLAPASESKREVLHTANAVSMVYPPLQAALGLVVYIEGSIDRFKSNKNEIKSIGAYAQRLAEQLKRSVDASKTANYVGVIKAIGSYLQEVARQNKFLQYLHRDDIAGQLQDHRNRLWEAFVVFSITCDLDLKESQREAELARQKDASESRILLESISHNVQTSASGIRELNEEIAIPSDQRARTVMLQELESIQKESTREDFESTVLRESIALTKLTLTPNYRWFRETFNAAHYTRSQIQEALIDTVHDIAGDLRDSGLLAHRTKAELASARTGLDQADIMFRVLDSRPKDVVLIRTFQRALFRAGGMQENDMVNPKLALAEGLVDAPM